MSVGKVSDAARRGDNVSRDMATTSRQLFLRVAPAFREVFAALDAAAADAEKINGKKAPSFPVFAALDAAESRLGRYFEGTLKVP